MLDSRINVTKELIQCITSLKHKPKMLISASGVAYGDKYPGEITDDETLDTNLFSGNMCDQWEKLASSVQTISIPLATLRIGVVLGKDSPFIKRIVYLYLASVET